MSILKWLTGGLTGGDATTTAQLNTELNELFHSLAPAIREGTLQSIAIASAEPREGRTRTALFTAEVLADNLGGRVLLVDADRQHPSIHEAYGIENERGLAEVLIGEIPLADVVQATLRDNEDVLTAGGGALESGQNVTREGVAHLLAAARESYDVVVFDTGPLLVDQEAVVFCHSVSGVILVLLAGITQGELAARAQRLLQRSQSKLFGVVINDPRGEFTRHEG